MTHLLPAAPRAEEPPARWTVFLAACALLLAGVVVYWNSFQAPLVFDARLSIIENPTIRQFGPLGQLLLPPLPGATVEGRPLLNLSFAINYAFGQLDPWGYHAANLTLHLFAGLALFGIVRRTLLLPQFRDRVAGVSTGLALAVAVFWVVHPLQTESVTNVVQRAESLMGWLFLLSVYLSVRAFTSSRPLGWKVAAVSVCLLGMAAKEVMAAAPLTILLYDRVFISTTWREVFEKRGGFHLALCFTWGLLAFLVIVTGSHGGTVGFGFGLTPWDYAKTQFGVVLRYLALAFWPHPLVVDYGIFPKLSGAAVIPQAIAIFGLVAAAVAALRFRPWAGFLAVSFFFILAPTSSVMPIVAQTMAEHRMYLPLAPLLALVVVAGYLGLRSLGVLPAILAIVAACVLGGLTIARNADYRSELALWEDCVAKWPTNARAQANLGFSLVQEGRVDEGIARCRKALEIAPDYEVAHNNLGFALFQKGQVDEAIAYYEKALASKPRYAKAHNNLGLALAKKGDFDGAISHYEKALEIRPDDDKAHNNLASALAQQGKVEEAIPHYYRALEIHPENAKARYNLGTVLLRQNRVDEAIVQFRKALEIQPDYAKARDNLDRALQIQRTGVPP